MVLSLTLPLAFFYVNYNILGGTRFRDGVKTVTFFLDLAFNLFYLTGIFLTVFLCLNTAWRKRCCVLCPSAILFLTAPLLAVSPIGPRCMYVPYILLVCVLMFLAGELFEELPNIRVCLRIPVCVMACAILAGYLWISYWNGQVETLRVQETQTQMKQGNTEIYLPSYPYYEYIHGSNGDAIQYYYYYDTPGDIRFRFVPYAQWEEEHRG